MIKVVFVGKIKPNEKKKRIACFWFMIDDGCLKRTLHNDNKKNPMSSFWFEPKKDEEKRNQNFHFI